MSLTHNDLRNPYEDDLLLCDEFGEGFHACMAGKSFVYSHVEAFNPARYDGWNAAGAARCLEDRTIETPLPSWLLNIILRSVEEYLDSAYDGGDTLYGLQLVCHSLSQTAANGVRNLKRQLLIVLASPNGQQDDLTITGSIELSHGDPNRAQPVRFETLAVFGGNAR